MWQQARQAWKTKDAPAAPAAAAAAPAVADPYLSTEEVLEACTQVYPRETSEPAGLLPSVQLRPYQKQSLAFMIDIEQSTDPTLLGEQYQRDTASVSTTTT